MRREELDELHYITPVANVRSILERGILSHRGAERVRHQSVAKREVQELRRRVVVPGGRRLHDYVNLYICARNPMLFLILRQRPHHEICVLRVSAAVVDFPGVVVTDQNAASDHVRWGASLAIVDRDLVFAEYWTHPGDQIAEWRHRSVKCAEVLVPDQVPARYVEGAYVSGAAGRAALTAIAPALPVSEDPHLFFR
jgi:hypothetical protein